VLVRRILINFFLIDFSKHDSGLGVLLVDRARLAMQHHSVVLDLCSLQHGSLLFLCVQDENRHVPVLGNSPNLRHMPVLFLKFCLIIQLFLGLGMKQSDWRTCLALSQEQRQNITIKTTASPSTLECCCHPILTEHIECLENTRRRKRDPFVWCDKLLSKSNQKPKGRCEASNHRILRQILFQLDCISR
jgi:hypothetical protein